MLSQRREMGSDETARKITERWSVTERSLGRWAPKAWEQSGSMPKANPDSTE